MRTTASIWLGIGLLCSASMPLLAEQGTRYLVFVSNERSGDVTVIDGGQQTVRATIPVGKRPRGIHADLAGKRVYVALSGTPISGPPQLNAKGDPILHKDDDDDENSDHSADGIGVVDVGELKLIRKLFAGSDPEQFAVSADGQRLYVANEDVATASVLNVVSGKVEHIIPVKKEPEGVSLTPGSKRVFVTCETGGEVFVIDTATSRVVGQFTVGGRPRSVAFVPDGSKAFIPSESAGTLHVIDVAALKETKTIRLPPGCRPMGSAMARDGKRLYLSTGRGGSVCVIDPVAEEVVKAIKVGARPWGLAISPDAKLLYVANGPSNDVSVIDLASDQEITRIKAGQGPWGIEIVQVRANQP